MVFLGTTERGEDMEIGTYIEQAVDHELSGNIIDLCPVGALNNKPYRYSARSWEMTQRRTVSPHDCVGSNMYAHVLRGTVKRIVPRDNERINETWIADRDRFSYEGIYSEERLLKPRIKESGTWRELEWEDALTQAAEALTRADAGKIGMLASPSMTVEEAHLVARVAEHLGTANIDHRTRRRDFSDQDNDPVFPSLGCSIEELETRDAIFVVGSNIRREAPIIAHRIRKAAVKGAAVSFASAEAHEYFFDVHAALSGSGLVDLLSGVAVAAAGKGKLPKAVASICDGVKPDDDQRRIAASLDAAEAGLVLLGNIAGRHRAYSVVRALAAAISELTGTTLGFLSEGSNTAGAHLAGVLPHRGIRGEPRTKSGLDAGAMLDADLDAVVLVNVEPDADLAASGDAVAKLVGQGFVVAVTPYVSDALLEAADLLLPAGTFAETSGTFVNVEGTWQSFPGVASPVGAARPTWKILRVLGNLLEAPGFEYVTSEDVLVEARSLIGDVAAGACRAPASVTKPNGDEIDVPLYSVDGVVRRARALQLTPEARRARGEAS